MSFRWGLLGITFVVGVLLPNSSFAESGATGGVLALDPNFFEARPSLSDAEPGEMSCTIVEGITQRAMNNRVAKEVRAYCAGDLTIEYIQPRKRFVPLNARYEQEKPYTRICCRVKAMRSKSRRFQQN